MWEILKALFRDLVSTQSLRIAFYSLLLSCALIGIFLVIYGYSVPQIIHGVEISQPTPTAASASYIRHFAAIAFLPLFVLIWFVIYLQVNSERDDLYSRIRQKLEGRYNVIYRATHHTVQVSRFQMPLQVQCDIRINPENKKLELVFLVNNHPIYTDKNDVIEAVALRHDSGNKYELMYYLNEYRFLKPIVTDLLVDDTHFSMDKGMEVKIFGMLKFEAGLDRTKVQDLSGEWFDLNGKVTQIFALTEEAMAAEREKRSSTRKSLSEVNIAFDATHALVGGISFTRANPSPTGSDV
jgi:hypothetical protein